jgi:magnesium transporter
VNDVLYLSTPLSYRSEDGTSHVAPLGFVLSPTRLITVRFARAPAFDTFAEAFARGEVWHPDSGMCSTSAFVGLLETIVDRLADVLEQAGKDLDTLSRGIFRPHTRRRGVTAELRATLSQLGRLGDGLSNIRDGLLGVSRIVNFTPVAANHWLPKDLRPRFKTLHQDLVSLTEYDAQLTNKVGFLLDAILGFINIEQNNSFRVLTVVSVVGIPPTLVASIYGMNFEHIPELHWAYGYFYGLAVIALSAITPLIWFRWRGWI